MNKCKKDLIVALDIGTSSVRAMVFDPEGKLIAQARRCYVSLRPRPGFEEQDPRLVREQSRQVVYECTEALSLHDKRRLGGLCCSSQMYSLIALDKDGEPLTHAILWSDGRASVQASQHRDAIHPQGEWYPITGCPASSMYPVHKLEWMAKSLAPVFKKSNRFVSIKEFVLEPLIGCYAVDHSVASATGMLDVHARVWSESILKEVGINIEQLPLLVPGARGFSCINAKVARQWGLDSGMLVFTGAGDGPLANLGSGANAPGMVNIDLGTSGAARVLVEKPVLDEHLGLFCYCLGEGTWTSGGIVTNAGNALQWCASNLVGYESQDSIDISWTRMDRYASSIAPGSEGVVFLPFLRAVRSPHWDDRLVATAYGLGPDHDIRHICRALYESIAYDIGLIIEGLSSVTRIQRPIVFTGGLSKSIVMATILADVLEMEVMVPYNTEGSIAGAGAFGLHALGVLASPSFASLPGIEGNIFRPNPNRNKRYRELMERHKAMVRWVSTAPSIGIRTSALEVEA